MSPAQLLKELEKLGSIEPSVLRKVRKHFENPNKEVKLTTVLSYLVKKDQISKSQARSWAKKISAAELPTAPEGGDPESGLPLGQPSHDTAGLVDIADAEGGGGE